MLPRTSPVLAVLASGEGSNFEALAHAARSRRLGGRIVALVSDRDDAKALGRARRLGIESLVLPVGRFRTRIEDETLWIRALRERQVSHVVLAGFMRRLHATFLFAFPDRILNIHPSLLPAFPGLDAVGQALAAGVRITGCTVHVVTGELDGGPILGQACVPVHDGDTRDSLAKRIHVAEHALYPAVMRRFLTTPWRHDGARITFLRRLRPRARVG